MKKRISIVLAVVLLTIGGGITSCKSKQMTVAPQEQPQQTGRIKKERDECQTMGLNAPEGAIRAWGEGVSMKESFATNLAELDARTKIARQIELSMEGLINSYNQ